jgi:hypothetical protein
MFWAVLTCYDVKRGRKGRIVMIGWVEKGIEEK